MAAVPTKGNLMNIKRSLILARMGYDLMDRKRNILIREIMSLMERAEVLQGQIEGTFKSAYGALRGANITLGMPTLLSEMVGVDESLRVRFRSVMGVEIPYVTLGEETGGVPYGLAFTNSMLDQATMAFRKVKRLSAELAQVEISIYRLAFAIQKTQKRANALQNIIIPGFEKDVKDITDALEEKEREEFVRLKVIKEHL